MLNIRAKYRNIELRLLQVLVRPKKNPVFRATRPYLSEPADPRLFYENTVFFR